MINSLQHEIGLYPIDDVNIMDSRQMPLQARFLGETFAAVVAREKAFPAAFPFHVSAQITEHRVAASAFPTGEAGARETC